jgi:hypothetical protein
MSPHQFQSIGSLPATSPARVGAINMLYKLFLITTAFMPLASLFWDVSLVSVKMNWAPYPLFLFAVVLTVSLKRKTPGEFVLLIFLAAFYLFLATVRGREVESIFRFVIAIMPLTFYFFFENITVSSHRYFWWIYCSLMLIPVFFSYLQYTGRMPYYEFDYSNDLKIGRISGGYNKPNNLIAFTLPIFLLGFYLWKVKARRLLGLSIVFAIMFGIFLIGHRTSLIAFVIIFFSSFFMSTTRKMIYSYYNYFLNFFVPILAFIGLRIMFSTVGLWDAIRGRVPVWQLHALQFFDQGPLSMLFGLQTVLIQPEYQDPTVVLNDEAHNNSFRTIIVFGLAGFFLYCLVIRKIVLHIQKADYSPRLKFILFSCFTYLILYCVTNEPLYYGATLWPIMIWIFLVQSMPSERKVQAAAHGS